MDKILKNSIRCKRCGDVIESRGVHEMVWCSCHSCAVDGGREYLRRCFAEDDCYEELSVTVKTYNKLVRDRIPEIIEASGNTCKTEILPDDEYINMIDRKLDEELAEYHKDESIEELADLLEVVRAAAVARGCSVDELERIRAEKAEKRGGFQKKIKLVEVYEASKNDK
jgi:predicted house-cleaning noncanonical NTP pyrophosphatase (MazG superfamily)